jgi:hypothetical protein
MDEPLIEFLSLGNKFETASHVLQGNRNGNGTVSPFFIVILPWELIVLQIIPMANYKSSCGLEKSQTPNVSLNDELRYFSLLYAALNPLIHSIQKIQKKIMEF